MKLRRIAAAALLLVAAIEAASFAAYLVFLRDRLAPHWRLDPDAALAALTPTQLERYRTQYFDPTLGWVFKPETNAIPYTGFDASGARRDPLTYPAPDQAMQHSGAGPRTGLARIAAYGDSFTFGEDLSDVETWPHLLAVLAGAPVANFGVAGYGTDQALLRLEQHLDAGQRPEVAVLAVLSENIARAVNRWRFAYTGGEVLNFKPMLAVNGTPHWLPTPLPALADSSDVRAAAARAAPGDYWRAYNATRPRPHFPYTLAMLDTAHYLAFRARRWNDLWRDEVALRTLRAIVDEFVTVTEAAGVQPALVMIPMPDDLHRADAGKPALYADFMRDVAASYRGRLVVVDVLAEPFDRARFNLRPYSGHASAYGNWVIAQAIAARLRFSP